MFSPKKKDCLDLKTRIQEKIEENFTFEPMKPAYICNGFKFRDYFRIGKTCGWGWCIVYKSPGGKIGDSGGGRGVLPFCIGRTWFKLAITNSKRFLPVYAWQVNSVVWLVMSLQIWNSKNTGVLLDSGLNLFNNMANLRSKLYCEVLLKSWNYVVCLSKWISALDFDKEGCVRQIWVD